MKKILKSLIASSLSIALTIPMINNIYATNTSNLLEVDELYFDSYHTPESFFDKVEDKELQYGDTFITKEDIQTGIDMENKMNSARTSGEIWTLTSSSTYKAFGPIKGNFKEKLACGEGNGAKGTFDFSITYITKYGISLTGNTKFEFEYTRNGPSGTEAVGSNHATHRYFVGVGSAKIMKYTFKITDKYTGTFLRNQTSYVATNLKSNLYGVLGYLNSSNNKVKIKSVANSNTKTYDEDTFIKKCSTEDCWSVINF